MLDFCFKDKLTTETRPGMRSFHNEWFGLLLVLPPKQAIDNSFTPTTIATSSSYYVIVSQNVISHASPPSSKLPLLGSVKQLLKSWVLKLMKIKSFAKILSTWIDCHKLRLVLISTCFDQSCEETICFFSPSKTFQNSIV